MDLCVISHKELPNKPVKCVGLAGTQLLGNTFCMSGSVGRACWDPAVGQYILYECVQWAGLAGTQLLGNTFCMSAFSGQGLLGPSCWTIHSV